MTSALISDFTCDDITFMSIQTTRFHIQGSAKKAWLFAKLQPGRARKRINATYSPPFSQALYLAESTFTLTVSAWSNIYRDVLKGGR